MASRAGQTVKLSISIAQKDLLTLRKRAKRVSGGNVSAAITEMIRLVREWEGREKLAEWLGEGREEPSEETMTALRAEWRGAPRERREKPKRKKSAA